LESLPLRCFSLLLNSSKASPKDSFPADWLETQLFTSLFKAVFLVGAENASSVPLAFAYSDPNVFLPPWPPLRLFKVSSSFLSFSSFVLVFPSDEYFCFFAASNNAALSVSPVPLAPVLSVPDGFSPVFDPAAPF